MQIPQAVIDEINDRADIVDVIGKHLKLKRSGANYFTACPFHNEKTASFSVNAVKQMFHCFGCSESGNAISFIMKYLGLDFVSAIEHLADQYGITIPDAREMPHISPAKREEYKQHKLNIYQTLHNATKFYQDKLQSSRLATEYLNQRDVNAESINLFELGYAPDNFKNLASVFKDYEQNQLLLDGGLISQNEQNKRYDRFRGRIIFPIRNIKGEIIGFGGRITGLGEPKYLNSPETELFNKSKELYGLFEAKKVIRDLNQVIVVEGYMDVIALSQYGIKNVVASMGTAITEEHIKILFRLCDNICYAFDGDTAGKKAAWRALERSIANVTDIKAVKFLFLPAEHDPDSYIRQYKVEGFRQKLNTDTLGLITFLLSQLSLDVAINSEEGKARLISLVKPYLEQLNAVALHVMLKNQLAKIVDLDPGIVENILNNRSRFAFYNKKIKQINSSYANYTNRQILDVASVQAIIKALFNNPLLARHFPLPELESLNSPDPDIPELFKLISYIEANCDDFADIIIDELIVYTNFKKIHLAVIYKEHLMEKKDFVNRFNLTIEQYSEQLTEIIFGKKRVRVKDPDFYKQ